MGQRMIRHVDSRRMETLRRLYEGGGRSGTEVTCTLEPPESRTPWVCMFFSGRGREERGG